MFTLNVSQPSDSSSKSILNLVPDSALMALSESIVYSLSALGFHYALVHLCPDCLMSRPGRKFWYPMLYSSSSIALSRFPDLVMFPTGSWSLAALRRDCTSPRKMLRGWIHGVRHIKVICFLFIAHRNPSFLEL